MEEKDLKKAVEFLKKLFISISLELNLTTVGGSNTQKLLRRIEDVIYFVDTELGQKLRNANRNQDGK